MAQRANPALPCMTASRPAGCRRASTGIDDLEATFSGESAKGVATRGASGSGAERHRRCHAGTPGAAPPTSVAPTRPIFGALPPSLLPSAPQAVAGLQPARPNQLHFGVREVHHRYHHNGICWAPYPHPVRWHLLHVLKLRTFRCASGRPHADSEPVCVVPRLSVAVGEDGPTHRRGEHLASFRAIPQLEVVRPADAYENRRNCGYFFREKNTLPAAMVLTRQNFRFFAETAEKAKDGVVRTLTCLSTPRAPPASLSWPPVPKCSGPSPQPRPLMVKALKARVGPPGPSNGSRSRTPSAGSCASGPPSRLDHVSVELALPCRGTSAWPYGKPVSIESSSACRGEVLRT